MSVRGIKQVFLIVFCLTALVAAVFLSPQAASAAAVNADRNSVAIKGYDPVAYFSMSRPVKGKRDFEATWMGATWRFASAENRERFREDPDRYVPRYGGYCAYGVAENALFDIDPAAWTVHDGRLYLNKSLKVRRLWSQDIPGNIRKADRNWPALGGAGETMPGSGMKKEGGMMEEEGGRMEEGSGTRRK